MKVAQPPEPNGSVQEQIDDIRTYLNLIYRQLLLNSDNAAEMLRTMYESISTNANGTVSDLFGKTIHAKQVIVESDLDGSRTIIDGGAIKTGSVTAEKIAAGAITADKIQAGAVTTEKMTANSINGDRIQAGTLSASKIVAESIGAEQIAANAITGEKILADSIEGNRIKAGTLAVEALETIPDGDIDYITFNDPVKMNGIVHFVNGATALGGVAPMDGFRGTDYRFISANTGWETPIYGNINSLITALRDLNTRVTNLGG